MLLDSKMAKSVNIKNRVKIKNKQQTKGKNKYAHKKLKKSAKSAGNEVEDVLQSHVFTQRRTKAFDDDEDLDELMPNKQSRKKRSADDEHDATEEIEMNHQIKSMSRKKKTWDVNRTVSFALPIKTQDGQIIRKARKIDDDLEVNEEKNEQTENKVNGSEKRDQEEDQEEKPKTAIDLIRRKKEILEKTKEKIAFLSRQVIENPQEQVLSIYFAILFYLNLYLKKPSKSMKILFHYFCQYLFKFQPNHLNSTRKS